MRPYTEKILSENVRIRSFAPSVSEAALEWHRDQLDRVVEVVNGKGWMFQRDNQIPFKINPGDIIKIEAKSWHRVIKGEGELVLKITEKKKLSKKQMKIARAAPPEDEITGADFKALGKEESEEESSIFEVIEEILEEKKKRKKRKAPSKNRKNPKQYDAPQGSDRDKGLDAAAAAYAAGDVKKAARIRDRMEKKARKKPGWKNKPRKDTGKYTKESTIINESEDLRRLIEDIVEEVKLDALLAEVEDRIDEKKKKKKKKKKSKSAGKLSAAVKKSLDKKADKRCLTRGSVYSEFRKGLAAYLSSGSRKGMSAHQWAHARVNSANPSKSWASVKKRKKCPSKKKKK